MQTRDIKLENIQELRRMYNGKDYSVYTQAEMETEWERREQVANDLKAKELTTVQKLAFITKNDPENEKYDIDTLFRKSFDHALSKHAKITSFSNGANYVFPKFKVCYTDSVADNYKTFLQFLKDRDILPANFAIYHCHCSLFGHYYFRPNKDAIADQFNGGDLQTLLHFIQYLVMGKLAKDYKETNEFMAEQKLLYNAAQYQYTFGSISVKRFANGRIDIKGLSVKQWQVIHSMLEINDKVQRS